MIRAALILCLLPTYAWGQENTVVIDVAPKPKFTLELSEADRTNWSVAPGKMNACILDASISRNVTNCAELKLWLDAFAERIKQARPVD